MPARDARLVNRAGGVLVVLAVLVGSAACGGTIGPDHETATGTSAGVGGPTSSEATTPEPGERVGAHPRPTVQRVLVVGDSITRQSDDDLLVRLGGRVDLRIEATPRATAGFMLEQVRGVDIGPVDQLVINVGTNDLMQAVPLDRTIGDIVEIIRLYPEARCVHLVSINGYLGWLQDDDLTRRTKTLNRALRFIADEWPRIHLIDWAGILAEGVETPVAGQLLLGDSIHTDVLGQAVLADAYVAGLDRCDEA